MSHQCKALILQCIDFRFHSAIRDFLVSLGLKDQYDLASLAGAAKGLVDKNPASVELLLQQADISKRLHGITDVYIIHHMDCGAYGGHAAFVSVEEERTKQLGDMEAARQVFGETFPGLTIHKILARIEEKDGKNKIDFEMIQ
ncbi:MAG: hypothetical protein PHY34_03215 [Patescibacteria group bacterium]|nr:hypothetical protein [Patescibacteria group bacterium]MDD5716115.1 hypothetical protein [Patescibacteria group bacterium]